MTAAFGSTANSPYYAQAAAIAALVVAIRYVVRRGLRAVHLLAILNMLPRKTSLAILTLGAFILLPRGRETRAPVYTHRSSRFPSAQHARDRSHLPIPRFTTPAAAPKRPILEPNLIDPHDDLRAFYLALWRTELGAPGAITRVLHYGDSPVTADSITADVRSLLQQHFGDAGHGFVLIAKPWAWYGHRGVEVQGKGWHIDAATQARARDGFHGLGGVSFEGDTGAIFAFRTCRRSRAHGNSISAPARRRRAPGGSAWPEPSAAWKRTDSETQPGYQTFPLNRGHARKSTSPSSADPCALFGVSFERNTPGVIYNSLGLNGGQVQVVVRYFDKPQWTEELQHEHPDLVVINYGTNESIYADYIERYYPGELRQVIERVKAAVPRASVLIMSPMDRGQRDSSSRITTVPTLPRLVEIQRQMAPETGCAFFNTFQAMGGEGTMARWYDSRPGW